MMSFFGLFTTVINMLMETIFTKSQAAI